MSLTRFSKNGFVCCSIALLAACGGGGGGSSTPTPPPVSANNAPVLAAIGDQSITEGGTSVVTASATDSDGDSLSYSISGSDAARFSITNSGVLTFLAAPDFENPLDANSDNVYALTISVSDGRASDSESIDIAVTDVFDGRVVDGPIEGAEVTFIATGDTATTDSNGEFTFPSVVASAGQQVSVSGGVDTFTGNALPDLVLIATVASSDKQNAPINAITTVLAQVSGGQGQQQVLTNLGVNYSPSDIGSNDIWALAEGGDAAAENAQRVNFQLAVLFQTLQVVVGDGAGVSASDVTLATATAVADVALASQAPLSLAREAVLGDIIADTLLSLAQTAPSAAVMDALVAALADANTVLSDSNFTPTSELARGAASAVQTAFQAAVDALIADGGTEAGRTAFANDTAPSTLFADVNTGGNTSDIDDDGLVDVLDADDDGDDVRDGDDAFPTDGTETTDNDGDGTGDNADTDDDNDNVLDGDDAFPFDADESLDTDGDGVGNNADTDDDGDGVADDSDDFPLDENETTDSDGDGVGDNGDDFPADPNETADSDGDGVGDNGDAFPADPNETADSDNDGVGDNADVFPADPNETADSDGDGVGDNGDAFPNNPGETADSDGDGVGDNADVFPTNPNETIDSDGDGVGDNGDAFPNDPNETLDTDGDGVGNNADAFPEDATETADSDGDGVGDNADAFPSDPNETLDTDGDGVGDNADAFPEDATETADSDGDGVGDNADAFPADPNETADSDGDGVGDNGDAFPNDPDETLDTDGDGVGDNGDAFPNDPDETLDTDGDGVGDNGDAFPNDPAETTDSDGDGVGDNSDAFPNNPAETADSDGDGVGDNADAFPNDPDETLDTDGDGVGDNADAFPNDPNEQLDTDGDGIGNNADPDDDGDGVNDEDDVAPLDPDVSGYYVSGQLSVNPDVVLDSDTNSDDNPFTRNNQVGNPFPNFSSAQPISSPFILHGYVNKPQAGAPGPLFTEGDEDDFFLVDALAGQRFILEIPDPNQDLDFYLFDTNGSVVAASENPPGYVDSEGFQEVMTAPADGTYYLNVYAYSFQGFPTASNYTVITDFAGAVSAQSAVRAGEVIVSLKSGRFDNARARVEGFSALSARHSLQPAAQSRGKHRLMRSRAKSNAIKFENGHEKFGAMANDALRTRSEVAHLIKALQADPDVEHAEPNFLVHRHATTNDPLLPQMWHLNDINLGDAWDTTTGDPSIVVAIVDNGVLAQHPDFLGQNSEGYDFISSPDNYDGDGIDPDPEDATPLNDECSPTGEAFYHGAHVGGTVGATGNNEEGIAGVSYGARLMHLRVLNGDCGGNTYDVGQAVLYAIGAENDSDTVPNTPASVINMSLGGGGASNFFQDIINEAVARDVIVVASSGNEGANAVSYPAAYDNVFAVGATGFDGNVASYSNQGPRLDLVAPGGGNGGGVLSLMKTDQGFTYLGAQGTSMSSPHAAGVFALMKSVHPGLTPARLEALLEGGVLTDDLGDVGFDNETGWGLLKADKAVAVATADANGTFVFPARLVLSQSELYFDGTATTTVISGSNPGEVGLEVTSIDNPAAWLTVSERNDAAVDEVGRWDITVDATGLTPGFYSSVVTYNAVDDEGTSLVARVTVSLRVGKLTGGDLGSINVILEENGSLVATAKTDADADYIYRIAVPSNGSYTLTASTDTDGDGLLCTDGEACGRWGGVFTPAVINLSDPRSDLDITVSLPTELE